MTPDVLYLAALEAAAAGGPEAGKRVLALADDPEGLARLLAALPKEGAGDKPATFRG